MHKFITTFALAGLAMVGAGGDALARPSAVGPGGPIPDLSSLTTSVTLPTGTGVVSNVTVDFFSLSHTWSGDLIISLEHNGVSAYLLNRLGRTGGAGFGSPSPFDGDYSIADGGADMWAVSEALPFGDPIPQGVYRPSGEDNGFVSLMGTFGGMNAAGLWTLLIQDVEEEDEGSLGRPFAAGFDGPFEMGWRLNVDVVPAPGAGCALLGAIGTAGARRRR